MPTGEGQELLLLINRVGNLGSKGMGCCRGTKHLEKTLCSFLVPHGLTAPHAQHHHHLLILGIKHRALQAEARAQLAHAVPEALWVPEGFQGSFIFQQAASLPQTSMPSENLWLCDPGRPGRGLSTDALRAGVPWAVTDEQHFHCHACFILVAFPEHPRLRGRRFGSFPAPEAVWGLHLKVLVNPPEWG